MATKFMDTKEVSIRLPTELANKHEKLKGFLWFSPEFLRQKTWYCQVLRKIRRSYLSVFHKDYVEARIANTRSGNCNRCGACCEILGKCPFLGRDAENFPYCKIYGELRPASCKTYPIDSVDADIEQCSYTFKE